MKDADEARRALVLGAELDEQPETPTRGASAGSTGTVGPHVGQSGKDPTSLADVTEPVGSTEPKLGAAMVRFTSGMKAIRSELGEMVDAFKAAVPETTRGRGVASVLRVLQGIEPMLRSAEDVAARALGSKSKAMEDAARVSELAGELDEEPLTPTTDADRSTEPRKKLDPEARDAVDQTCAELGKMHERLRELGYQLQGVVEKTSRPDGIRDSVTDLSEADTVLVAARQRIAARFK